MPDEQPSEWAQAVKHGDLATLQTIIHLVTEHEQMTGRTMTPKQLADALSGRLRRAL